MGTISRRSLAESLALLPASERTAILATLTPEQALRALWDWERFWARPSQVEPPGDWLVWLNLGGRGAGKTRTGSEWTRKRVLGGAKRIAFVARNPADARDVMVEGESGILAISPPWERPKYEPSKRRLTWPNGAVGTVYTSYEPDQLRGPQFDTAWADEMAAWKYPRETWDNLMLALRLGEKPRACVTTTPKPIAMLKELLSNPRVSVTKGNTYENRANLALDFFAKIVSQYAGTSLGRQEIYAEILSETPGALWKRAMFNERRQPKRNVMPKGKTSARIWCGSWWPWTRPSLRRRGQPRRVSSWLPRALTAQPTSWPTGPAACRLTAGREGQSKHTTISRQIA